MRKASCTAIQFFSWECPQLNRQISQRFNEVRPLGAFPGYGGSAIWQSHLLKTRAEGGGARVNCLDDEEREERA